MNATQTALRNSILGSVRQNQPAAKAMPAIPHFHAENLGDLVATFRESLTKMAGVVVSDNVSNLDAFLRGRYPNAKVICSSTPEYAGTIRPTNFNRWSEASTIDVCVVRSPLAVAETGSVLLSDVELQVNTIAFLAHDLVVLPTREIHSTGFGNCSLIKSNAVPGPPETIPVRRALLTNTAPAAQIAAFSPNPVGFMHDCRKPTGRSGTGPVGPSPRRINQRALGDPMKSEELLQLSLLT